MAEHHCGHIKAVRLQYQWWCHQKAVSWGGLGTLCVDYVPSYQVLTVKDTIQQQPQSLLWPLGLDMIPGLTSFVDPRWSLEVTKYQVFFALSGGQLGFSWTRSSKAKTHRILIFFTTDKFKYLSYFSKRCLGCEGFGFGCCLWPCKDPLTVC